MKLLYVYTARGCGACEEAKPFVEEFKRGTWGKLGIVFVDVTNVVLSIPNVDPRATPTYVLTDEHFQPLKKHEGVLNATQLNDFVFGDFGKKIRANP